MCAVHSRQHDLFDMLFDGYNPSLRPVLDPSRPVDVVNEMTLTQIVDFVSKIPMYKSGLCSRLSSKKNTILPPLNV